MARALTSYQMEDCRKLAARVIEDEQRNMKYRVRSSIKKVNAAYKTMQRYDFECTKPATVDLPERELEQLVDEQTTHYYREALRREDG